MFALGVSNRATGFDFGCRGLERRGVAHTPSSAELHSGVLLPAFGGIVSHDVNVYEVSQVRALPSLESGANPA